MSNSILDNMPPDEREALLSKLRDILKPKAKTVRDVGTPNKLIDTRMYWHVYSGAFDTMVDYRDADSADRAIDVACLPLQPWYVRKVSFADAPHAEVSSHKQYVEWLRRH